VKVKAFLDDTLALKQAPRPKGANVPPAAQKLAQLETVGKEHGRVETRR
jgi:hypothetical protein